MNQEDPHNPLSIITEAVVRGAIAEGKKALTEAAAKGWSKLGDAWTTLRARIGSWSGAAAEKVNQSIDRVAEVPDRAPRHEDLALDLKEVPSPIPQELIVAAQRLIELLDAEPHTLASKQPTIHIIQKNIDRSAIATTINGPATAILNEKKTS